MKKLITITATLLSFSIQVQMYFKAVPKEDTINWINKEGAELVYTDSVRVDIKKEIIEDVNAGSISIFYNVTDMERNRAMDVNRQDAMLREDSILTEKYIQLLILFNQMSLLYFKEIYPDYEWQIIIE